MVKLIKLNITGEVGEVNISLKKNEKYNLNTIKSELQISKKSFKLQHEWEIENKKVLRLLGSSQEGDEENFHQLPIKTNYQFYGNLYAVMVNKNVIQDLDLENFENIYNALYCDSEGEDDEMSEEDVDEDEVYSDIEEQKNEEDDDEDLSLDNYGDENSTDEESIVDQEEKKKSKVVKKKKAIKIIETRDILRDEEEPPNTFKIPEREKMLKILLSLNRENEIDEMYFREMEMEIFNYAIKDSIRRNIVPTWNILLKKIYVNKARSLYINLLPDSYVKNTKLYDRMKKKEFTAKELVNMTNIDLFPENWQLLLDEKFKKNKVLYETKREAMTDQFKCRKCGSRETCYYEMQTRSADEPMTIFITCLDCGNRWKN